MKSSHLLLLVIYFGVLVVVLSLLFRFVRRNPWFWWKS